jgi:hypothetical protein
MAHVRRRTIFAPVSKEDPKHGRWILPLVVLALVAFTFTFVNSLPAADTVTTITVAGETTTTTTTLPEETTTTTLPEEIIAFVATVDSLKAAAIEMRANANTINDEYPDITGYGATRDLLSALRETSSDFADEVAAVEEPTTATAKWGDVKTAAAEMNKAADDMFDGLVNTSGSEARLAARDDFNIAAATFDQLLDAAKELATDI